MTKELTPEELSELREPNRIICNDIDIARHFVVEYARRGGNQPEQIFARMVLTQHDKLLSLINQLEATQGQLAKYEVVVEAVHTYSNEVCDTDTPKEFRAMCVALENLKDD